MWRACRRGCSRRNTSRPLPSKPDGPRTTPGCFSLSRPPRSMRRGFRASCVGTVWLAAGGHSSEDSFRVTHDFRPSAHHGKQARLAALSGAASSGGEAGLAGRSTGSGAHDTRRGKTTGSNGLPGVPARKSPQTPEDLTMPTCRAPVSAGAVARQPVGGSLA